MRQMATPRRSRTSGLEGTVEVVGFVDGSADRTMDAPRRFWCMNRHPWREPFGQVVVEAWHEGCRSVATDGGGHRRAWRPRLSTQLRRALGWLVDLR